MPEKVETLTGLIDAWVGGAGTALIGAWLARMMWHIQQVKKKHRRFFSLDLIWEAFIAVGMAMIGEGLAAWLSLGHSATVALIGVLSWLGPRGTEVLMVKWWSRKVE